MMEAVFELEYRTVWGERLVWCAGGRRVPMEYGAGGRWRCRAALPTGHIEYAYEVERGGRKVRCEWRPHRLEIADGGDGQLTVRDHWSDIPADAPFYASAFTETIFARRGAKRPGAAAGRLVLTVEAPTVGPGEVLALAGSAPELGGWNRFHVLDDGDFPQWRIALDCGAPFEYKFLRLDRRTRRPVAWEPGENRRCEGVQEGCRVIEAGLRLRGAEFSWRGAGTAVPLFSLRTSSDFGVGEFPDLKLLVDWAVATGQQALQLLPVNDTMRTGTRSDSYPYSAVSSFALHPLYLSLPAAGLHPDERYRRLQRRLDSLPAVDYEAVVRHKLRLARRLFRRTWERLRTTAAYAEFAAANRAWLEPYAAFSALRDRFGTADFRQWGRYARYDGSIPGICREEDAESFDFYCFLQYHLHRQLLDAASYARRRGVVLKGDIPIGVSAASADVWQHPGLFRLDGQAGAPPDAFAAQGQNWGFPTYDWEAMARDGYAWWRARLRKMSEYFDAYRIDHILGFFRIWEIPAEAVHGVLGRFRPALPFSCGELAAEGFRLPDDRYTQPHASDAVLRELFGRDADEVRRRFFDGERLRPEWSTQRAVLTAWTGRRGRRILEGLLRLLDDVLFIEDDRRPDCYHPRIDARETFVYRALPAVLKQAFDRLHEAYFYRRHNDFWRDEALRKLPALLAATPMLACGEDLGMIPACVPETMARLRILSLEIERMPKTPGFPFGDPAAYPYFSVCTTSTHDMAPLRGWWRENTVLTQRYYEEVLHRSGAAPADCTPALCRRIVERHLAGRSMWTILPLQDWLATDAALRRDDPDAERINVPADPHHYWRYRMHLTVEKLLASDDFNRRLRRMIRRTGRGR